MSNGQLSYNFSHLPTCKQRVLFNIKFCSNHLLIGVKIYIKKENKNLHGWQLFISHKPLQDDATYACFIECEPQDPPHDQLLSG